VGSARTALFAYLYAKRHGGEFVLRIEDTDRERSTEPAVQAILDGMAWLGLVPDQPPVYQTHRFDRYAEVAEQLLQAGKAYRCYCSKERLAAVREAQMAAKQKPQYDRCCRSLSEPAGDRPFVLRFKTPLVGAVSWQDAVSGPLSVSNTELDDLVLMRTDGTPTYNFTVVVDDWDMGITDVIRGNDHVNNTPRQINIFTALGAEPPRYAHLPMILSEAGKKLSKRDGAANLLDYRDAGYLPQALRNYLVRLGWSHGDQELFTLDEMIALFDLEHVNRSPARLNTEKLLWINQHYLKTSSVEVLLPAVLEHCERLQLSVSDGPDIEAVIVLQAPRCKTLVELVEKSRFFFEPITSYDEKAQRKGLTQDTLPILQAVQSGLEVLTDWSSEPIHAVLTSVAEQRTLKLGKVAQPVRVALSGGAVSPPLDSTAWLLGREETLLRVAQAITTIEKG
jgi:glutamyl-tRNA synthetase